MRLLQIFFVYALTGASWSRAADDELRVLFAGDGYRFQVPEVFLKHAGSTGEQVVVEQVSGGGWTSGKHAAAEATFPGGIGAGVAKELRIAFGKDLGTKPR